jgi:UDP-2,3-diacylglucosamine hydrolase
MSVALVADSHLGGPGGEAKLLIEQIEALPDEGCERLILLGDIFHYWVGSTRYETPDHRAFVDSLRGLRARGVVVDYIEGNRDFFLGDGPYADAFDRVVLELAFEVGDQRCLAVHGDGIDERDRGYRFWRWLSKNALSRFFWFHLPGPIARAVANSMEARLSRTNFEHKIDIPDEMIRRYGSRRLQGGHDLLLLGHFHEARQWTVPEGKIRLLDAWFRSRRVEWIRP